MVSAGKVFKLREESDLTSITAKLKNFKKEESFDEEPLHTKLLTEICNLALKEDRLEGIYSEDKISYIFHHGERLPIPRTIEVPFAFVKRKDMTLLVIMERKLLANNIANRLSEAMFITSGYISEARIAPDTLRDFHEKNPSNTKIIFFDDVDIPNISKLSLYGSELLNTTLYNDYCRRGKIWYIVVTSKKGGNVVGITRNSVVTVFNNMDKDSFLNYVTGEVFPLIQL